MSHFATVKIPNVVIKDREVLVEALKSMGYQPVVVEQEKYQLVNRFNTDNKFLNQGDVYIPAGKHYTDIGFSFSEGSYHCIYDSFDVFHSWGKLHFLNEVAGFYSAYEMAREYSLSIENLSLVDGKVTCTMRG